MASFKDIDRVKKLLALSKNNPNAAEASSAAGRAKALIEKLGISEQELEEQQIFVVTVHDGNPPWWMQTIASLIEEHYDVVAGVHRLEDQVSLFLAGYREELAKTVPLFIKARKFASRDLKSYLPHDKLGNLTDRLLALGNDFLRGWLLGAADSLRGNVAHKTPTRAVDGCSALVPRRERRARRELEKMMSKGSSDEESGPVTEPEHIPLTGSLTAFYAGVDRGARFPWC